MVQIVLKSAGTSAWVGRPAGPHLHNPGAGSGAAVPCPGSQRRCPCACAYEPVHTSVCLAEGQPCVQGYWTPIFQMRELRLRQSVDKHTNKVKGQRAARPSPCPGTLGLGIRWWAWAPGTLGARDPGRTASATPPFALLSVSCRTDATQAALGASPESVSGTGAAARLGWHLIGSGTFSEMGFRANASSTHTQSAGPPPGHVASLQPCVALSGPGPSCPSLSTRRGPERRVLRQSPQLRGGPSLHLLGAPDSL